MGQSNCGRTAAALAVISLGLPPAFAMDRAADDEVATDREARDAALAARPCPTRFDYVVLASFADGQSLLSLSTYHFRSEVSFSTIPLTGLLQVDYKVESSAGDCGSRGLRRQIG